MFVTGHHQGMYCGIFEDTPESRPVGGIAQELEGNLERPFMSSGPPMMRDALDDPFKIKISVPAAERGIQDKRPTGRILDACKHDNGFGLPVCLQEPVSDNGNRIAGCGVNIAQARY